MSWRDLVMNRANDKSTHFSITRIIIRIQAAVVYLSGGNSLKIRFPTKCVTSKVGMNTVTFCFGWNEHCNFLFYKNWIAPRFYAIL